MTRFLAALAVFPLNGFAHGAEPCADASTGTEFAGEVRRGAVFAAALGGGVAFRLVPTSHGWTIWIGDPAHPADNFAAVATPPFRGINPLIVEGWHFRNADNSGPNRVGPKNINAPQQVRAFSFVADRKAFLDAQAALAVALWPGTSSSQQVADAKRSWQDASKRCGRLTVTGLALGNLQRGEKAWIDRLAFTVAVGG